MESYDPRRPEIQADPYPALAALRARNPVAWNAALRGWLVTRYPDVRNALSDSRFSSNRITPLMEGLPPARRVALSGPERILTRWLMMADAAAHARLRHALSGMFAPSAIAALQTRAKVVAGELLDRAAAGGTLDAVADFASPLSSAVIAGTLGLPLQDVHRFAAWFDDVAIFFTGAQEATNRYDRAAYRLAEMDAHLRAIVRERLKIPSRGDAVDSLVAGGLDEDELVASVILILFAGHQTTANLIGNGVLSLLRHPAELARLRARSDVVASAIEEMLRYESPTACVSRIATAATELGGRRIARGDTVWLMINAANRDAAQFPEPDRFDLTRADNRHLAFGHGVHECVGATLARLHAQAAFSTLLERFPVIELADERPSWRDGFMQRGLAALKMRVRAS